MRDWGKKVRSCHRGTLGVAGARNPEIGSDSVYRGMQVVTVLERLTWEDMRDNIKMQSKGSVSVKLGRKFMSLNQAQVYHPQELAFC